VEADYAVAPIAALRNEYIVQELLVDNSIAKRYSGTCACCQWRLLIDTPVKIA
jgi:hypothetical protein